MNALVGYLAIGVILYGVVHGVKSEECNNMQEMKSLDMIAITIAWPAGISSALFFDFPIPKTPCKGA